MPFTILHLSDLHRSSDHPISNEELLSSLVSDFDRAATEDPAFGHPDAIVISGDVVQGVALGTPDHAEIIAAQYDVALDLVAALCDRFVGGDRARVVLVPGNHDVDWNVAFSAMQPIPDADLPNLAIRPKNLGPRSDLRWDWTTRRAYRIIDNARYADRLAAFRTFVARVYDSATLRFAIRPEAGYSLFEFNGGRIGVAALDSCFGNDCFSFHGAIAGEALAQAHMDLHDRSPRYDLMMAVWHHSVEGPPEASDYLDIATVYDLIGRGFRLGLHGHQHRAAAKNRYVQLPRQEPMAVVSAGSLCAGPFDLPTGVNRQYNVLEVSEDCRTLRVHVREMVVGTVFAPSRRAEFGGESYVDMTLAPPLSPVSPKRIRDDEDVLEAERLIASDAPRALAILRTLDLAPESYARSLAIKAAQAAHDWDAIEMIATPPASIEELVAIASALASHRRFDDALAVLDQHASELNFDAAQQKDVRDFIAAGKAMG